MKRKVWVAVLLSVTLMAFAACGPKPNQAADVQQGPVRDDCYSWPPKSSNLEVPAWVEDVLKFSVVKIGSDYFASDSGEVATGFWFSDDIVVTAAHVIKYFSEGVGGGEQRSIWVEGFTGERAHAELLYTDSESDIAVLYVPTPEVDVAIPKGDPDSLRIGDPIYIVGFIKTYGLQMFVVGSGCEVLYEERKDEGYLTNAGIYLGRICEPDKWGRQDVVPLAIVANVVSLAGNSGGPGLNAKGEVVGIMSSASIGDDYTLTVLVPIDLADELVDRVEPSTP